MLEILDKDTIINEIIPYLPIGKRGFKSKAPLYEIVNSILYKLKTGIQWSFLPTKSLFSDTVLSYKTVFGYFRRWCKANVWQTCWEKLLSKNKSKIDLSNGNIDGSHTPTLRGGEEVAYQGRKKRKTTNALFLTDNQGIILAMSEPIAGNHNDLYEISTHFKELTDSVKRANIETKGLFINLDAGFDSKELRNLCVQEEIIINVPENTRKGNSNDENDYYFDEKLYDNRYVIERSNAWEDSYRSVLNRFDTTVSSWKGNCYLSIIVIGLKKFIKKKKSR